MAGQLWGTSTLGGYFGNPKLSRTIRNATEPSMSFRQFVGVKEALGKNANDTVYFNKISSIGSAGGTLVEGTAIVETNYTIQRGTIVVTEYGNAIPYSGKLASLSEFGVKNETVKVLMQDQRKVLDSAACAPFKAGDIKYVASGTATGVFTTDGTATGTAASNGNAYHVQEIADYMKKNNVPAYDEMGNYMCIASVHFLKGIRNDTEWLAAAKYGEPARLFSNEVGRWRGVRFIEETNNMVNTLGSSTQYGEAVFFGDDAVMEAVATPAEIRVKTSTDYGRNKGVGWVGILGWTRVWDYSTDGEFRTVHVTSV